MNNIIINNNSNEKVVASKIAFKLKKTILTSALSLGMVIGSMENGHCMQSKLIQQNNSTNSPHLEKVNILKSMDYFNQKYVQKLQKDEYDEYTGNNEKIDKDSKETIVEFLNIMSNSNSLSKKNRFFAYHTTWTSYIDKREPEAERQQSFNKYVEIFARVIEIENNPPTGMINFYHTSKAGKIAGDIISFRQGPIYNIYQTGTAFNSFFHNPEGVLDENFAFQYLRGEQSEVYFFQVFEDDYKNNQDFRSAFYVPNKDINKGEYSHLRLKHSHQSDAQIKIQDRAQLESIKNEFMLKQDEHPNLPYIKNIFAFSQKKSDN